MLFETVYSVFKMVTFGIMSTLVAQVLILTIIKHDKAGYHWRLWGFEKGRHGGKLAPTVCWGLITAISLFISAVSIPIILNYFKDVTYLWFDNLGLRIIILLAAEFLFTCFFLIHFVKQKVMWDKWKIGFLLSSMTLALLFVLLAFTH